MRKGKGVLVLLLCAALVLTAYLAGREEREGGATAPQPVSPEIPLSVPERPYNPANAEVLRVWMDGGLKEVELEKYLPQVLAGEMPVLFHPEALRAQAVAARSYLLCKRNYGCKSHPGADVCGDPSCCTAYCTEAALQERWGQDYEANMEKLRAAVNDTAGEYLVYEGEIIQAVFHSSSVSQTEDSANVWNPLPYLVSVDSPETEEDVPNYITEITLSAQALREAVLSAYPAADFSEEAESWIGELRNTESGRVQDVMIGGVRISGTEARRLFGLRSTGFTVAYTGDGFLFRVTGYGHGVGMSQYGANVMAKEGASYSEILMHYYPNTEIVSL